MDGQTHEKADERTFSLLSVIVACICIAAYALALVVAGVQIGLDIKERRIAAERDFSDLADRSSRLDAQAFMDESFQDIIRNALTNSVTLQAVILTGPNGEYAFERSLSGSINWEENTPRFAKQFGVSSLPFRPLPIEGLRNVTLSAVYRYIDIGFLLSVLKRTLVIVLAALTVAFFALILESLTDKRQPQWTAISPDSPPSGKYPPATKRPSPLTKPAAGDSPPNGNAADDDSFDDVFRIEDDDAALSGASSSPGASGVAEEPPPAEEPAGALESVAPDGISPEKDTRKRLDAELRRAESSGQDLTVAVLEYGNPNDPEGAAFEDFVRITADYFGPMTMTFEKGDTGITAILPGTSLDAGIEQINEFRDRIPARFARGLAAGISSRQDRQVAADRLLLEAVEATVKSREDPENRVVAFKSDPEKYRAFIEKKSAR
jgi:hypothetical protein